MNTKDFVDPDLVITDASSSDPGSSSRSSSSSSPSRAEIDARVEQARQQMLELRRQQEELERERQELEELRRREEEFEHGKAEMLEALGRAIATIEKEEFELNKKTTSLSDFRQLFQEHVRKLQDIHENEWRGDELKALLAQAISVVENARAELNRGRAQISFLGEGPVRLDTDEAFRGSSAFAEAPASAGFNFVSEFQRGFARSLPILILGVIVLFFWLLRR
ncbi:MAG: hypothetical protein ACOYMV_04190 [Verrucomicrobiia bacterium]